MKKLILLFVVSLTLLITGSVWATSVTLTYDNLLAINNTYPVNASTVGPLNIASTTGGVSFSQGLDYISGTSSKYAASLVLGYLPGTLNTLGLNNLSAYDEYTLTLKNLDNRKWSVNIFLATSTSNPVYPYTYQGMWTWLNPGDITTLTINLTGISNLNHVTNIGFIVASCFTGAPYADDPDSFAIQVFAEHSSPIPEPSTLLFLGTGILSLAGFIKGTKGRKK